MSTNGKNIGEFIGTAFVSYIATNIDDLVVLMNFFTEAAISNSLLKVRHICIGRFAAFIILVGVSLIGYGVSYALPVKMLGFLGFLPIMLGIKAVVEIIIEEYNKSTVDINEIIPNDNISTIELETVRYRNDIDEQITREFTIRQEETTDVVVVDPPTPLTFKQKVLKFLSHCLNLQTLKIISITLANSGDNVAIYTPLFAQATNWQIGVYIVIFFFMMLVWLVFCYSFINFRPILNLAQKYAHYIVPIVFIGIGIYIIAKSDCFPWLVEAIKTKSFTNG
ncbi:unnamed protein product [Rotaria magnacalcarata]|uniref:Cadmium resistance transporter n=3 Tax=Rotaria magnacalcarata TaxID=392030 RepID=A0A815KDE0_9BILA|nr:unnamed protein product [Rotaria magnacalcarata]